MTDREKVIKGLEELRDHLFHEYKVCYHGDEEDVYRRFLVVDDALALLKEQEPVRVGEKIKAGDVILDFYPCGHCKNAIRKPWRYCPFCGKAVKWE